VIGRGTQRFVLEIASSREVPLAARPNWSSSNIWMLDTRTDAPGTVARDRTVVRHRSSVRMRERR
jgi:hypothetical protein